MKILKLLTLFLVGIIIPIGSCSDIFLQDPVACSYTVIENADLPTIAIDDTTTESVVSPGDKDCLLTEYYLCPGISGPLMRIVIVKDICFDPPQVISVSECEEFLECNPSQYIIGTEPCITYNGYEGVLTIYCDKGFIRQGECIADEVATCDNNKPCIDFPDTPPEDIDASQQEEIDEPVPDDCSLKKLDILFLIDMSGSMKLEIGDVITAVNYFSLKYSTNDILWGMIAGPFNAGATPGNKNYLEMVSDLQGIDGFKKDTQGLAAGEFNSQYEMLYDALYLSIRNISLFVPYENDPLLWPTWIGDVFAESQPPINDFNVNWRPSSEKMIVIFTNEIGQSFLFPSSYLGKSYNTKDTITQTKLHLMLETISSLRVYTFTDPASKSGPSGWSSFSDSTGGEWFLLYDGNIIENLNKIVESNICQ